MVVLAIFCLFPVYWMIDRKEHPDAKKKDIALAALATMMERAESGSAIANKRPAKGRRAADELHH